jgi:hypothetical protein
MDDSDRIHDELKQAGWSVGEYGAGDQWFVSGNRGPLQIRANAASVDEAWQRAADQARLLTVTGELRN